MILKMMMRVIKEDCTKKKEPFQIVEAVFLLLPVELCYYFVTRSNKNPHNSLNYRGLFWVKSTQSRDRTGMEVNPLVFETSASTNSAIWAFSGYKITSFFLPDKFFTLFLKYFRILMFRFYFSSILSGKNCKRLNYELI